MSNLTKLVAEARKSARHTSKPQPYDGVSKADLWERLQAAERAMEKFQTAATLAHNFAQGETGEPRRKLFAVRDAIYSAKL